MNRFHHQIQGTLLRSLQQKVKVLRPKDHERIMCPADIPKVKVDHSTEILLEMNDLAIINTSVGLVMIEEDAKKFVMLVSVALVLLMIILMLAVEIVLGHRMVMYLLTIIIITPNLVMVQDIAVIKTSIGHVHVRHQDGSDETEAEADQVAKERREK